MKKKEEKTKHAYHCSLKVLYIDKSRQSCIMSAGEQETLEETTRDLILFLFGVSMAKKFTSPWIVLPDGSETENDRLDFSCLVKHRHCGNLHAASSQNKKVVRLCCLLPDTLKREKCVQRRETAAVVLLPNLVGLVPGTILLKTVICDVLPCGLHFTSSQRCWTRLKSGLSNVLPHQTKKTRLAIDMAVHRHLDICCIHLPQLSVSSD